MGGLIELRNATLEDHSWRTGGGAVILGSTLGASEKIVAAVDFWPNSVTQRTIVVTDAGKIWKDDGLGAGWVTLATGLTVAGSKPYLFLGGAEQSGNNRKVFYHDGLNQSRYLDGNAAAMTLISAGAADWSGSNWPTFGCVHEGWHFAGGNPNAPNRIYRSNKTNQEVFNSPAFSMPVFSGMGERLVAAMSYKGVLLLWAYPHGVYAVDTSDSDDTKWRIIRIGYPGAAGAWNITAIEDDVMWVSPDGSWHLISATTATGSVRAEDLTARKLGAYIRDQVNLAQLSTAQLVYYSQKQEVMLACHGAGATAKNRRLHMDLNKRSEIGERWLWWDVDQNEALFLRKKNEQLIPAIGDEQGRIWELDQAARTRNGAGYQFSWFLKPTDFSEVMPGWQGRKKNLRFLQLEYDPRTSATHTVDVYVDGNLRQTINFSLTATGAVLPVTLPFVLGTESMLVTQRKRLRGQGVRLALRGRSSNANEDVSLTRILVGLELGE